MRSNTLAVPTGSRHLRQCALALLLLVAVIGCLFVRSFQPGQTLFSNDGPLGAIAANQAVSAGLSSAWADLNWVGSKFASASPDLTFLVSRLMGPLLLSKFYAPLTLVVLGLGAWVLFWQLGLKQPVRLLGALAIALNTEPFSYACWGLGAVALSMAATFVALAAVAPAPPVLSRAFWLRVLVAQLALGCALMEGADVGAILSLYVAGFIVLQQWNGAVQSQCVVRSLGCLTAIALLAAVTSARTVSEMVGIQIKGVAVLQEKQESKVEHWNWATQWSLPKAETLRLIIPGLFGYRMDTPGGGKYWGTVGQQPGWEEHHQGLARFSGAGCYAGVLAVLVAFWALFQAAQTKGSVFTAGEKRVIWFWSIAACISLFLAFGRYGPFYQVIYPLPFFSSIRNPVKFLHPLAMAITILFAYGLEGLYRKYLDKPAAKLASLGDHLRAWWKGLAGPDRRWVFGSALMVAAAALGWLLYASSRTELQRYLTTGGSDAEEATLIAGFSIWEVGLFVLVLAVSVAVINLVVSGWFAGPRTKWAVLLIGAVLVGDLARANLPWIIYYDYQQAYASNPVLDLLRQAPQEHRVAGRLLPFSGGYLASKQAQVFPYVYEDWLQHQFQYYNIQSLDIVQMPRLPEFDKKFYDTFSNINQLSLIPRLWQLTNTRYILGMSGYLDALNQQFDPVHKSFRLLKPFDFALLPSASTNGTPKPEDFTAGFQTNGSFAIFELTNALPRAKLFAQWQVATNDQQALQQLANPTFDPNQSVLVSDPLPASPASAATTSPAPTVAITQYAPKHVELTAEAGVPTVLLLNDRFDPDWKVTVDSKPQQLLRLNFIMRGVQLTPGRHTVEFRFAPIVTSLYVSLAAIAAGVVLALFLALPGGGSAPRQIAPAQPQPKPYLQKLKS